MVTLTDPPPDIRPGLSTTAKITTATRSNALTIPIQALTVRRPEDLIEKGQDNGSVHAAAPQSSTEVAKKRKIKRTRRFRASL